MSKSQDKRIMIQKEHLEPIDPNQNKMGLTKEEQIVHDKLMGCFLLYMELPFEHPEDTREFCYAIHLIQGLLTMRTARRQYPEGWSTYQLVEEEK